MSSDVACSSDKSSLVKEGTVKGWIYAISKGILCPSVANLKLKKVPQKGEDAATEVHLRL